MMVPDRYRRDPHQPTSRDLVRDLDRLADAWVFEQLGTDSVDPDQWPRPDDGRLRGEVSFESAVARVELGTYAESTSVPRGGRPLEQPKGNLCVSCGLAPIRRKRDGLCDRCRKHVDLTGNRPGPRANYLQARRLGIRAQVRRP
jgi:hypothetical protein